MTRARRKNPLPKPVALEAIKAAHGDLDSVVRALLRSKAGRRRLQWAEAVICEDAADEAQRRGLIDTDLIEQSTAAGKRWALGEISDKEFELTGYDLDAWVGLVNRVGIGLAPGKVKDYGNMVTIDLARAVVFAMGWAWRVQDLKPAFLIWTLEKTVTYLQQAWARMGYHPMEANSRIKGLFLAALEAP